ncbi:MAG: cytochrome c biogenesis protein CcdA [Actinomycetota bacterium]|nr:cytochrome c biogenesis protein CcdA [Actinomycetota bacterium]
MLALSFGPGGLVAAFGAGMLSCLSPCVLPLMPGYLSLMSGVSTAELAVATRADTRKVLRSTLLFVAGFTVVFVALGATASAVGQLLGRHQRGLNQIAGATVILMGLVIAGVVSPRILARERRLHLSPSQLGSWAPPLMGMAFAFGWTPCIGPILASVLAFAYTERTLSQGVALLLAYSLGMGVPFVASGLAFGRLAATFEWFRRHYRALNLASGLVLVAFGVLLLTNRVGRVSSWLIDVMSRVGLDRLTAI